MKRLLHSARPVLAVVAACFPAFVSLCADTAEAARNVDDLPKPAGQLHDPAGWFPLMDTRRLEAELLTLRERDGIDLKVAVLTEMPEMPGPPFTEHLAARWGEGDSYGLVVHVPGSDGPWLAVGGTLTAMAGRKTIDEVLSEASRRVAGESEERRRVTQAIKELSDFLRFLGSRGLYHEERWKSARLEGELERTRHRLTLRLALVGGVLVVGAGAVVCYGLWRKWRRHAPFVFPETRWRRRFGAPWCGGGDAVVRFAKDRPRK